MTLEVLTGAGEATHSDKVRRVQVALEDCMLLEDARRRLNELRQQLGDERMKYLAREAELHAAVNAAGDAYEQLVGAFASKYIQRPGRYNFRPEQGAFVLTEEAGNGEVAEE